MSWKFGARSRGNLDESHPKLVELAVNALARSPFDFGIIDGGRTLGEQRAFVAAGKSWTLRSRHRFAWPLRSDGRRNGAFRSPVSHAVDFMVYLNGKPCWEFPVYERVYREAWLPASRELSTTIKWGGHWKTKDGPHIQLAWSAFPARYATDDERRLHG